MTATPRIRIDTLMVQKGLVPSRERARALILAGRVLVSEQKVDKPGIAFPEDVPIRMLGRICATSAAAASNSKRR
jgi:23S rRNA (cytidine1920-2'-O)/16S rRNA (cytidine1409-2'-O)-methyltransferase